MPSPTTAEDEGHEDDEDWGDVPSCRDVVGQHVPCITDESGSGLHEEKYGPYSNLDYTEGSGEDDAAGVLGPATAPPLGGRPSSRPPRPSATPGTVKGRSVALGFEFDLSFFCEYQV
jgi:hypothetical protein